jgi:hypothetical protein
LDPVKITPGPETNSIDWGDVAHAGALGGLLSGYQLEIVGALAASVGSFAVPAEITVGVLATFGVVVTAPVAIVIGTGIVVGAAGSIFEQRGDQAAGQLVNIGSGIRTYQGYSGALIRAGATLLTYGPK